MSTLTLPTYSDGPNPAVPAIRWLTFPTGRRETGRLVRVSATGRALFTVGFGMHAHSVWADRA